MAKTFIIGDIHGCYDELIQLIHQMGVTEEDLVVSLGDIVDRGNKSLEIYEYFRNRPNSIVLMGNHERKHLNGILSYSQEIVKVQFGANYSGFLEWLERLLYYYETDEAIIVHAFFEHDVSLAHQKEEVLAGTTSGSRYLEGKYDAGTYWSEYYRGSKPIIYGHHVVGDTPKLLNNTYGIDTGACHGGKLTAIELPGFRIHQVPSKMDYWKDEQVKWQIPVLNAKNWEAMTFDQVHAQLKKLSYKAEPKIQIVLAHLNDWVNQLQELIVTLKTVIEELSARLKTEFGENFNQEVAKLHYRTFIFKASTNNLTMDNLRKTLDTPQKVMDLAENLGVEHQIRRRLA